VDVFRQDPYKKNDYLQHLDADEVGDVVPCQQELRHATNLALSVSGSGYVSDRGLTDLSDYLIMIIIERPPADESENQKPQSFATTLDTTVSVWSDFNSLFYHPRTVNEISAYQHDYAKAPFALFSQGREVWRNDPDLVCVPTVTTFFFFFFRNKMAII
jgi:hypothetical protein